MSLLDAFNRSSVRNLDANVPPKILLETGWITEIQNVLWGTVIDDRDLVLLADNELYRPYFLRRILDMFSSFACPWIKRLLFVKPWFSDENKAIIDNIS